MSVLAEQSLVGCLLMDKESVSEIYGMVKPDMFSHAILKDVFNEYLCGYENRYDVNLVTLKQKLANELYTENDLVNAIKECMSSVAISTEIKSYAQVIVDDWKVKQVDKLIRNKVLTAKEINGDIGKLIAELEALQENNTSQVHSLAEITEQYKNDYFKEREIKRVLTGFSRLDETVYLEGGDITIIAARPAVGKSALAAQIAIKIANTGKRVAYYNLEMKEKQMYERFLVNASGLALSRIKSAIRFLGDEKEKFDKGNELLSKRNNLFITSGSKSASEIRNECRHMGYDVIIIDYLQLLKADRHNTNRSVEVGDISKSLKAMAMELNVPVIVLSQLNRVSESGNSKEPTMSELRESGDIEQDASNIILLWNLDEQKKYKGLKVDKNRQGDLLKEVLEFAGDKMQFVETDMSIKDAQNKYLGGGGSTPFD